MMQDKVRVALVAMAIAREDLERISSPIVRASKRYTEADREAALKNLEDRIADYYAASGRRPIG